MITRTFFIICLKTSMILLGGWPTNIFPRWLAHWKFINLPCLLAAQKRIITKLPKIFGIWQCPGMPILLEEWEQEINLQSAINWRIIFQAREIVRHVRLII